MNLTTLFRKPDIPAGIHHTAFTCSRDGLTIGGHEYRPQGNDLPAAIVCHGFMADQKMVRHYALALAQAGYAAYTFDFNGGSVMKNESAGKTTDMSVLTEVRDLEAVAAYVRTLPYVNADDVLLMGCSQGGFVCALAAARIGCRRLAMFYPALCIPDDARAGKMMMARFDPRNVPETLSCGPMKLGRRYVQDVLEMDPFAAIGGYTGHVLIVHGTADSIVRLDYSQRAAEVYRACAQSAELLIIEGGGHTFGEKHDAIAIDALKRFAAKAMEGEEQE